METQPLSVDLRAHVHIARTLEVADRSEDTAVDRSPYVIGLMGVAREGLHDHFAPLPTTVTTTLLKTGARRP